MQNEKIQQKQQPKEESSGHEDIWTSAFDSQTGVSAEPPPLQLKASVGGGEGQQGAVMQRQTPQGDKNAVSASQAESDADAIYDVCSSLFSDGADVAAILSGKSVSHLRAVRRMYEVKHNILLEQHIYNTLSAKNYRAAMVHLFPALTLMQRLRTQKGFLDDNEEAMVFLIANALPEERAQARGEGIRTFMLDELDGMQLYESHKLVFPPAQFRGEHWSMAMKVIAAAEGWFWDDDDIVYMVILDLDPAQRKALYYQYREKIDFVSASAQQLRKLLLGTEAEVIKTSMDLATDGAGTYDALAAKTVDAAAAKLARKAELEQQLDAGDQSANAELKQIGEIERLVKPQYRDGEINPNSFLGDLEGDLSEGEYLNDAKKLGLSDFDTAKRMILNAMGLNDDERAIKDAFEMVPVSMRATLFNDPDVATAIADNSNVDEMSTYAAYVAGDSYRIAEDKLLEIDSYWTYMDANYVELIELLVSLDDDVRVRLVAAHADKLANWGLETTGNPELARAVKEAATTGDVSLPQVLRAASEGDGTEEELITSKLNQLSEEEYVRLRMGYALVNGFQIPESVVPRPIQQSAIHEYQWLIGELQKEMGFDELQSTIDVFLETPSLTELGEPGGMNMSMFIMKQRVQDKISTRDGGLSDGFIDLFSNSGGVADMAAIRALGLYNQAVADGTVDDLDIAKMGAGYDQFDAAYQDHVAACDTVADMASTVAAIAVAMAVIVISQGTATGPVIAALSGYLGSTTATTVVLSTAAAGTAKLAVSEAAGQEHFSTADEGAKAFLLGGVDGALTALTAGIAKSLQMSFYTALNLGEGALASEMTVGAIRGVEWSLGQSARQAGIHATRGTIDGVISGAIGNVVLTAADEATWRKSVWGTVTTLGASLLQGVAMGGLTGGLVSGGVGALGAKTAKAGVAELDEFATRAGIDLDDLANLPFERRRMVGDISNKLASGEAGEAETLLRKLQAELGHDPATRIRKHLYVANGQPLAKPHIDAYMEQLIRIKGRAHGLMDEQWTQLEGFFHGDPACLQTFIARSDEEMVYALRAAREETLDGAHGLSRHGPDVTDAKLEARISGGYAPDGALSPQSNSTRFSSYKEFWETRELALQQISIGNSNHGMPVDLRFGPGLNGNTLETNYKIMIDHSNRTNMAVGFEAAGPSHSQVFPHPSGVGTTNRNVWSGTTPTANPIFRTQTTLEWIPNPSVGGRWSVKQHFPIGRNLDPVTGHYTTPADVTLR